MRRKRRNRSTWFPVLGINPAPSSLQGYLNTYDVVFQTAPADGSHNIITTTLIPDDTVDPGDSTGQGNTLRDFVEGQTCIVERIVGKIAVAARQIIPNNTPPDIICCAAIAVLPVENDSNAIELTSDEYDPLNAANSDKPWLWRRTWILTNRAQDSSSDAQYRTVYGWPTSNESFGSALDGAHIDTKGTRRAIQRNQRLHLILCSAAAEGEDELPLNEAAGVKWVIDLRCLGRMVKAKNKSIFT